MRNLARAWSALVVVGLGTLGCGDDVPIGQGTEGVSGSGGSVGGAAGSSTGGSGGGSTGGVGAVGGASGGSGGIAGSAGSGGIAGSAGSGGSGGSTTSCPVEATNVQFQIPTTDVHDVLVIGNDVFFTQGGASDGAIRRAPLATGQAQDFATAAIDTTTPKAFEGPDSLATDGTNLLWRSNSGKSVWKKPLAGGPSTLVVELPITPFPGQIGHQGGLATAASKVFWVQGPNPTGTSSTSYKIFSAPLAGGGSGTELLSYDSGETADVPFMPLSLLADSSGLYFSLYSAVKSKTVKTGLDGSNPTDLFGIGQQLADAGSNVLLTSGGFAWRLPKSGAAQDFMSIGLDQGTIFSISQGITESQGDTFVSIFGTLGDLGCCSCGWIYSVPTTATSATPTVIWSGQGRPTAVSAGAGYVVTADIDNDEILILKP